MLPACNRGAGANVHRPDVCLTPPVPAPVAYVNIALNATAVAFVPHVFVCGLNGHNIATMLASSFGDEAGSAHWTIMGWSKYTVGNPIVNVGMLPGENLTCASIGNRGNAAGACLVPSLVNVFYTDAAAERRHLLGTELETLPLVGAAADALVRVVEGETPDHRVIAVDAVAPAVPLLVARALRDAGRVTLDLRGNPGGDLDAAVRLVELFVARGSVAAVVVDPYGHAMERRTRCEPVFLGALEVMVDEGTASAAEVVAAALHDLGRARIVGRPTWGKGTVATMIDGRLTTVATVRSPAGRAIEGQGLRDALADAR